MFIIKSPQIIKMLASLRSKIRDSIIYGNHVKVLASYPWIVKKDNPDKSLYHLPMIEIASNQLLQGLLAKKELSYLDPSEVLSSNGYNMDGKIITQRLIKAETIGYNKFAKNVYWSTVDYSCFITPHVMNIQQNHFYDLLIGNYDFDRHYFVGYRCTKYNYLPNIVDDDPEREEFHMMTKVELEDEEMEFLENYRA